MLSCQGCGLRYETIHHLPDEVWTQVTGITDGSGLYCMPCLDRLARSQGLLLYWEAAVGEFPTLVKPGDTHD